jgi:DinB superfamily
MVTLAQAIEQLNDTRAELLDAIHGIDQAARDRKGVIGAWSIKNMLAHIAAWEAWVVQALPVRLASGTTPPELAQRLVDEDASNAEEVAEREELTPDEQLMELERNRAELLALVRGLDEATLARPNPWDTWPHTLPEYLLDALRDHEAAHIEELRTATADLTS